MLSQRVFKAPSVIQVPSPHIAPWPSTGNVQLDHGLYRVFIFESTSKVVPNFNWSYCGFFFFFFFFLPKFPLLLWILTALYLAVYLPGLCPESLHHHSHGKVKVGKKKKISVPLLEWHPIISLLCYLKGNYLVTWTPFSCGGFPRRSSGNQSSVSVYSTILINTLLGLTPLNLDRTTVSLTVGLNWEGIWSWAIQEFQVSIRDNINMLKNS